MMLQSAPQNDNHLPHVSLSKRAIVMEALLSQAVYLYSYAVSEGKNEI